MATITRVTPSPFVSFAQNREDVVLHRALAAVRDGRYIDVGANDPTLDSVTKAFYDAGWRGVTVEPVHAYAEAHRAERPGDLVFEVAVTDGEPGEVVLHEFADTGLSTLVDEFSARHSADGREVREVPVRTRTLDDLLDEAGWTDQDIHFMIIDVEGAEESVLRSIDLRRRRPWIIVAEATEPQSSTPTHDRWEPLLTAADYRFAQFDGLSRFYVAAEKWDELHEALERPASPQDDFVHYRTIEVTEEIAALTVDRETLTEQNNALSAELEAAKGELAAARDELAAARESLSRTTDELSRTREQAASALEAAIGWRTRAVGAWADRAAGGHAAVGAELDQLRDYSRMAGDELAAMRATLSWRITRPLRAVRTRTRTSGS